MIHLTKQEMKVLGILAVLLLTGLAVKTYRTAHPPAVSRFNAASERGRP